LFGMAPAQKSRLAQGKIEVASKPGGRVPPTLRTLKQDEGD
jgi:hypothetical protein